MNFDIFWAQEPIPWRHQEMAVHCIPQYSFPPWHLTPEKNNFVRSILPSRTGTIRAKVCLFILRPHDLRKLPRRQYLHIGCLLRQWRNEWWERGRRHKAESDGAAELTVRDAVSMSGKRHMICRDEEGSLHPASWPMWLQACGIPTPPSVTPKHLEEWDHVFPLFINLKSAVSAEPQNFPNLGSPCNNSNQRNKSSNGVSKEDAPVQLVCVVRPRARMNDHTGGGRKGNYYISGPGKGADIKEVRNTRLKDRGTDLMTSHLCFILSEVLQKIQPVSQAIPWRLLLTPVCEELSLPIPHWFLSAALWWRESRGCHYLPPFLSVYFQSPGACAPSWPECERATDPSLGEGPIPGLLPHLLHHMTGCALLQDIEVLRKECRSFSR